MSLYSDPPEYRTFSQDKPTLLVCWWITIFCTTIIVLRVCGRYIRTERLFNEDKTAALAIIPLFLRMGCVHVILLYGTNNADFNGVALSDDELHRRSVASGLVLLSRILYALTLWIFKVTILEFFKRITGVSWERSYERTLLFIRITLAVTFLAIIISDLSECQPFAHYWQVLPDPGGQCRQGYAQLLTMAVCNVLTDLLLVFFPIPIIIRSHMSVKRKIQLVLLFSLSLGVVGVTIYRVPHIIDKQGRQQARSLFASVELLFATAAANALVLGSFVRDRGVKKRKYRHGSIMDSMDQSSGGSRSRRPTVRQWGSDEDLVRDLGLGVNPELREMPDSPGMDTTFHPAPLAKMAEDMNSWQFTNGRKKSGAQSEDTLFVPHDQVSRSNSAVTPRRVSFLDAGNLLGSGDDQRRDSYLSNVDPLSTQAPAPAPVPAPAVPASASGFRRGSQALLQDLGGLLTPSTSRNNTNAAHQGSKKRGEGGGSGGTDLPSVPDESPHESQYLSHDGRAEMVLMDPGGLLGLSKKKTR